MSTRVEELREMLAPVVEALGYELWGVELNVHGRHALLRIFIDSENGITVDDCALVSQHASGTLDVADPIASAYTLEVSSPGWDRPLFTPEQYQAYIGERVKLRLIGMRRMTSQGIELDPRIAPGGIDPRIIRIRADTIAARICVNPPYPRIAPGEIDPRIIRICADTIVV